MLMVMLVVLVVGAETSNLFVTIHVYISIFLFTHASPPNFPLWYQYQWNSWNSIMTNSKLLLVLLIAVTVSLVTSMPRRKKTMVSCEILLFTALSFWLVYLRYVTVHDRAVGALNFFGSGTPQIVFWALKNCWMAIPYSPFLPEG